MVARMERRAFSVAIYPRYRGKFLIIKHHRLGVWLPPGGECQDNETPLEAAARELKEETGLDASFSPLSKIDGTPAGLIGYEEHLAGSKGRHLNFVFVADVDTDQITPNEEFGEWRWVDSLDGFDAPPNVGQLAEVALAAGSALTAEKASAAVSDQSSVGIRWMDAFNTRDLDALLDLYAEDAVHVSPKLRLAQPQSEGKIVGKPALRAWWADCFARMPKLHYQPVSFTGNDERVWMEYLRRLPGESDLLVAEVLELRRGKIYASRVFHG